MKKLLFTIFLLISFIGVSQEKLVFSLLEDFNSDGSLDIIKTFEKNNELVTCILVNDGNGNYIERPTIFGKVLNAISFDINNDGNIDIITSMLTPSEETLVRSYVSNRDGTFIVTQYLLSNVKDVSFKSLDINYDGQVDLMITYKEHEYYSDEKFNPYITRIYMSENGHFHIATRDFYDFKLKDLVDCNLDGNIDIVGVDKFNKEIVYLNWEDFYFSLEQ